MHRDLVRPVIAAALLLASSAAAPQSVTLYGGVRGGGDFVDLNHNDTNIKLANGATGSLAYEWLLPDGRQGQILYSFQRSSLPGSVANLPGKIPVNISYLQAGGRVFFEDTFSANGSYLTGGLGVTYLSPRIEGLSGELRASMNLGLGYQWMLSRQLALRSEVRGYLTLINSSGGFFCSGGCAVAIRGSTLVQGEGMLGLSYAF